MGVGRGSDRGPAWSRSSTPPQRRPSTWPSSARASPSTPAASPSSRPRACTTMKTDMAGARNGAPGRARASPSCGLPVQRHRLAVPCREHAGRHGDHARATSSPCSAARPSRCSTPMPRAAWSWPTASRGAERRKPDAIIDVATLTGAQVMALGVAHRGCHGRRGRARFRGCGRGPSPAKPPGPCRSRKNCAREHRLAGRGPGQHR